MKQSNVVKCLALVCALSMPLAAFAASPGGAGTGGGLARERPARERLERAAPARALRVRELPARVRARPRHSHRQLGQSGGSRRAPAADAPKQSHRHQVGFAGSLDEQGVNKRAARWRPLLFVAVQ